MSMSVHPVVTRRHGFRSGRMLGWRSMVFLCVLSIMAAGCSRPVDTAAVPEPIAQRLAQPMEHSVPYDVEVTSGLGRFLVARGYYVPWTPDGPTRIYGQDIRLNSYTSLPNGTNVPYTLSEKAKPYIRDKSIRLATYQVEQVLSARKKTPPKAAGGTVDRYRLTVQVRVDPLLPGMPLVRGMTASLDVDYDAHKGKVLQVRGLTGLSQSVRKAIEKSLKGGG